MTRAVTQRLAPKVTVTHEKNAPVVLAPKKRDPLHSAWGNGVASTIVFTDPLVVTAQAPTTDAEPAKLDAAKETTETPESRVAGKTGDEDTEVIAFEPDLVTAKAPDEAGAGDAIAVGKRVGDEPAEVAKAGAEKDSEEGPAEAEEVAEEKEEEAEEEKEEEDKAAAGEEEEAKQLAPEPVEEKKTPAAKGGGDGAADLAAWKARATGATAAVPQPTMGDEPAKVTVISTAGKGAAAKHKAAGRGLAKEAEKAVRKPPETPKPIPPPPPTPVPEADRLIANASDKKLPNQELPALVRRPRDIWAGEAEPTMPVIDTGFAEDMGSKIELPAPEPAPEPAPGEKKSPDGKQLDKLKGAKAREPEENRKAQAGEKMMLADTAAPPVPTLETGTKGASKEKVAQVLAELLRSPGAEGAADEIINEARGEAFPRRVLVERAPKMGEDQKTEVLAVLKAQVASIRAIAGITQAELDAAIKTREENVRKLAEGVKVDIDTAKGAAKAETGAAGEQAAEDVAGARAAVDEKTIQTAIAANGEADPTVIELRRDKGIRDLTRRAARQDVFYEKAGERRGRALGTALGRMRDAYSKAARADREPVFRRMLDEEKKANNTAAEKTAGERADAATRPIFEWAARQAQALDQTFATLKESATTTTKQYRDGMKQALDSAKEMLRGWAEDRIARQESWWDSFIRMFNEWMKEAKDDSSAWEEARNEQLRDTLVADMAMLDEVSALAHGGADIKAHLESRGLDQAQLEIVQTYFAGSGPEGKKQLDAIGAVAAGMRIRVKLTRKPGLIEWFKNHVMNLPDSEWSLLGWVGNAENSAFEVTTVASELHQAMDQWGTEESRIFSALAGLTPIQARAVRAFYKIEYGRSLDDHLESEMSGAELDRAKAALQGEPAVADAAALNEAMSGAGTNEATIMQVLRGKTPEQRAAIVAEYKKRYGRDLEADLKEELDDGWSSHHDYDRATALMAGDTAKADAIALASAMSGAGTDEAAITQIYEQNRAEIEAEAARKGWTTAQMEAALRERNKAIEAQYESKYGNPNRPKDQPSALRAAFKDELSDAELGLADALAEGDLTKIDSAKLGVEKQSFITDDEAVNKILQSQAQRARKEVERDKNVELQFRAEVDAMYGRPWGRDKWTEERTAAKKEIDEKAKERSMLYMSNLETAFDKDWGGGKGGLVVMIAFNMSGEDRQKAFELRKQGGVLTPEQEIYYAVNGPGTDVDKLKQVLKGKSKQEIEDLKKIWAKKYPREGPLEARIMEEVGGNDAQEMTWGLQGEPEDLDAQVKRAHERKEYYKGARGWWGEYKREDAAMEREYEALVAEKSKLDELKHLKDKKGENESEDDYAARLDRYAYWEDSFNVKKGSLDRAIEDHEKAVNEFADTAATIAGIVAVIAVMVVVGIATGGAGAAAIGAALASAKVAAAAAVAAAVATVTTKALIKGKAYSHEEIAVDVVVGAVDAVASAMTAGVGGGLLKAARAGAPASRLAGLAAKSRLAAGLSKMAASERMGARVIAGVLSEGIEGVASSLPSALVGNVIDEKNWVHGNPLANIVQGTVIQTGIGAVVSGGMGGLGGLGKNVEPPTIRETGDVLAKRGPVADRMPLWKAWEADNPGKPYKDFLEQLDAGIIAKDVDDSARKAMQRELRTELLAEIPKNQRKQFADVPIEVMSEADFLRFTRSESGQAAVIFRDGKPVVILREGADIKALREEGIHLVQSKDPKWAKKFKQLDESRLANWEKLPLDEQLALYRTKLDIELDAQQRLLKNIDDQLASVDDPALRKSLLARREAATRNFDNLARRLDEVDNFPAADRLKIARKELKPPQYLDQKPRLFAKESKLEQAAAAQPAFLELTERTASAREARKAANAALKSEAVKDPAGAAAQLKTRLEQIWTIFDTRTRVFMQSAADKILAGKPLAEILSSAPGGLNLYDASKALKALGDVAQDLVGKNRLKQLDEILDMTERLLKKTTGLGLAQIEPLLRAAHKFGDLEPADRIAKLKKLAELAEQLSALPSFRLQAVPDVGKAIGEVLDSKGPKAAEDFMDKVSELASLTKARDAIGKNKEGFEGAERALEKKANELKADLEKFGLRPERMDSMLEEMSRTGKFDWGVFREKWGEALPLDDEPFAPFLKMLQDVRTKLGTAWLPHDAGPLRLWGPMIKGLHDEIETEAWKKMADDLAALLPKFLPDLTQTGYKKYRHSIKDAALDFVVRGGSAADQMTRLKTIMALVRKHDPASIGEYFATFRRKIFSGKKHDIQGALTGSVDPDIDSRQIDGLTEMVDGAIDVPAGSKIANGPQEGGRYLVEDKAGGSFSLSQAKIYSDRIKDNSFKTRDSGLAVGAIYFCEDPKQARYIAGQLFNADLDKRIYVATFHDNKIVFVPRPSEVVPDEAVDDIAGKAGKGLAP